MPPSFPPLPRPDYSHLPPLKEEDEFTRKRQRSIFDQYDPRPSMQADNRSDLEKQRQMEYEKKRNPDIEEYERRLYWFGIMQQAGATGPTATAKPNMRPTLPRGALAKLRWPDGTPVIRSPGTGGTTALTNPIIPGAAPPTPAVGATTQGRRVFTTLDGPLNLNRPGSGATNKMSGTPTSEGQGGTFVTSTNLADRDALMRHIRDNKNKQFGDQPKFVYEIEVPPEGLQTDLTEVPPRPTNWNIQPNTSGVKIVRMWEVKWILDPQKGFEVPILVEIPVPGR
jgi:hypothetical protein